MRGRPTGDTLIDDRGVELPVEPTTSGDALRLMVPSGAIIDATVVALPVARLMRRADLVAGSR